MAALTPTLYALTLTSANTQYSQALPADTRFIRVQCRTAADMRLAFVTGKVATPTDPYGTIKSGTVREFAVQTVQDSLGAATLYLASGSAGVVAEIEAWSA